MFGCQQDIIKVDKETQAIIEYLCIESNNLYNCAIYYARQMYFKAKKIVTGFDLTTELKTNIHFKAGYASSMQQTCLNVGEAFKSFKELKAKEKKGELEQKPKPPNYRKPGGLFTVTYPKKWLKLKDGIIRFPLGDQVKAWFGIKEFFLKFPSNLDWNTIKEVRILPRNQTFYAEFVYLMPDISVTLDSNKVLGIDHGLNNWLTCVSNIGASFIVDGKHLKSINQWYNKQIATMKEDKPQGFWSRTLAYITEKRNRQMRDAVNKAARLVINYCLKNSIGSVVFGWNIAQKDSANMGAKTNQKFVSVPTARLKKRIEQMCKQYSIKFEETEESYTSKASFLDNDVLPKFGAKPKQWLSSGKRVKRGLFRTAKNEYINADCNGAANIIRKVNGKSKFNLDGLTRGVLTAPMRIKLWYNSLLESPGFSRSLPDGIFRPASFARSSPRRVLDVADFATEQATIEVWLTRGVSIKHPSSKLKNLTFKLKSSSPQSRTLFVKPGNSIQRVLNLRYLRWHFLSFPGKPTP